MNFAKARLILSDWHPYRWLGASYLHRLVGICSRWRAGSWLLSHSESIGAFLIAILFTLAPFIPTSSIGILLIAIALFWIILTLSEDRLGSGVTPIHVFVFFYWSIAVIATALSPIKSAAFSGLIKLSLYLFLFALCSFVLRSSRWRSIVIGVFLHVSLFVSIYGLRQQFFGARQLATWNDPDSALATDGRVYSYLGNPNLLAGYLIGAIALSVAAVFVWQRFLPKLLALIMVFVNSSCLYFTDSRGGWIGMLAFGAAFLLLLRFWWGDRLPLFWRKWLLPMVIGGVTGAIAMGLILVEPLRLRVMSIFAWRGDSSNNFRINVWLAAIDMIRDRPLIGIGPGNEAFNQIYPLYMRPNYTALSAYSVFLETAIEIGLIGLSIFLGLIFTIFSCGLDRLKVMRSEHNLQAFWLIGAIAAIVGMLAHGIVDTVWYRPQINTIWWLMVAIIASSYPSFKQQR